MGRVARLYLNYKLRRIPVLGQDELQRNFHELDVALVLSCYE
jgi:hypothetical protein